ncbi:MAG: sugar-binding transcriptional regulator [Chloroflexi bacterium]|nr:sugar-binding transcriptional regulator [Chloroflexota bacterium]
MANSELIATLVQVATLYYEDGKSQQEIADQMGVSRSLVALYLKRAREQNIVRIQIDNPQDQCEDVALALQDRSGLRSVRVIPKPSSEELVLRSLGGAAARFLESRVHDGDLVGLGWGRTIMETVNLLAPVRPYAIEVVPLMGESSFTGSYTQMNQIVLQMARAFSGQPYFLLAPLMVGSPTLRAELLADETARPVAERWQRLNVACIGIGALGAAHGQVVYLGEKNVRQYLAAGAVGDIVARHFASNGQPIYMPQDDCILGIQLEQLRTVQTVVAVAGGVEKTQAVVGALRTRLITDLIVDQDLAQAVLAALL